MYVCSSASGRIIGAKDHASVQMNIADVSIMVFGIGIRDRVPSSQITIVSSPGLCGQCYSLIYLPERKILHGDITVAILVL